MLVWQKRWLQEMAKKKLGRGLDALFNDAEISLDTLQDVSTPVEGEEIIEIDIASLRPNPYQPRKMFDGEALDDLAASIKEHGIFQPLIIKKTVKGYEIVAGERRFRAAQKVGLLTVPAVVRDFSDQQMMEIALLENLQREDLNGVEEAIAYQNLIDSLSLTQEQLSVRVGKSRTHITNMLGILKLPKDIQDLVVEKKLSSAHARILSKYDNEDEIRKLAKEIISDKLSVRDVEKKRSDKKNVVPKDVHVLEVEEKLRCTFNRKVTIENNKVVLSYSGKDDLNNLLSLLIKE